MIYRMVGLYCSEDVCPGNTRHTPDVVPMYRHTVNGITLLSLALDIQDEAMPLEAIMSRRSVSGLWTLIGGLVEAPLIQLHAVTKLRETDTGPTHIATYFSHAAAMFVVSATSKYLRCEHVRVDQCLPPCTCTHTETGP